MRRRHSFCAAVILFAPPSVDFSVAGSPRTGRRKLPFVGGRLVRRIGVKGWNLFRGVWGRAGPGNRLGESCTENSPLVFDVFDTPSAGWNGWKNNGRQDMKKIIAALLCLAVVCPAFAGAEEYYRYRIHDKYFAPFAPEFFGDDDAVYHAWGDRDGDISLD